MVTEISGIIFLGKEQYFTMVMLSGVLILLALVQQVIQILEN